MNYLSAFASVHWTQFNILKHPGNGRVILHQMFHRAVYADQVEHDLIQPSIDKFFCGNFQERGDS